MAERKKPVTPESDSGLAGDSGGATKKPAAPKKLPAAKKKPVTAKKRRASRGTAATAQSKPRARRGTQRMTAWEIVERNAMIVKMREVWRIEMVDIAHHFDIAEATAYEGYSAHIRGRANEVNFQQAMLDMREYVSVLVRNQQALAAIAHGPSPIDARPPAVGLKATAEEKAAVEVARVAQVRAEEERASDRRAQIAAMHEMTDEMFKEIAVRQAIGDLPAKFSELKASRDFELSLQRIFSVLAENGVDVGVIEEIEKALEAAVDRPAAVVRRLALAS